MTIEKQYFFDTREGKESEAVRNNRITLGMDFRDIFKQSSTSFATHIHHEKLFLSEGGDSTYISYSSHEDSPRNTLIFNLYDKFLENKFDKEIEFNTILDISRKDVMNEVTLRKNFGISLMETEGELELLARKKKNEERGSRDFGVRIPLGKIEEGKNYYYFKASESEDKVLWQVIKENFAEGLLYHIDDLTVSYDTSEAELTLAMQLE